jgi:hypothetical protein
MNVKRRCFLCNAFFFYCLILFSGANDVSLFFNCVMLYLECKQTFVLIKFIYL